MSVSQNEHQPCRICLSSYIDNVSLNETVDGRTLAEMIRYCVKLEVFENDDLPYYCCSNCKLDLVIAYKLVIRCEATDAIFRSRLSDNKYAVRELLNNDENNVKSMQNITIKTEFEAEKECIYAEPISDLYPLNNDRSKELVHKEDAGSSSEAVDDEDDQNDKEYLPDHSEEKKKFPNLRNKKDGSKVDGIVRARSRKKNNVTKFLSSPKRCCKCKVRLENMQQAEQHSQVHIESKVTDKQTIAARPFECSVCFKRYTRMQALLHHQRWMYVEKQFQCDECDEEFLTDAQLAGHKKSHDNSCKKGQFPKCCACYQQFESEDLLKKHSDEVHLPESQNSTNDNENRFVCNICHRRYKTKRTLQEHKARPYSNENQCALCGKIFRNRYLLSDHERSHQEGRSLVCPVCSKTFATKDSYNRHVRMHALKEDRFKCEVCGKGFKTNRNLKSHKISHAPDYRPLICSVCSATFARKSCLKSHMRLHTGEKPYKCDICGASYTFPSDLKRHIMAHKGIKPYICDVCGRGYPRKDYLRKHLASHNASS